MSTTIVHDGKEYDYDAALFSPPIGAIDELNQALEVTPKSIRKFFSSIPARQKELGIDNEEMLYTHDYINSFVGMIFLAKRRAGEPFTIEQAKQVRYEDVTMRVDVPVEEQAVVEDPKVPSEQADEEPAIASTTTG